MKLQFLKCPRCGQIVLTVKNKPCEVHCCGVPMEEIVPNSTEASAEKHVPVWEVKDGLVTVRVGAAAHPMLDEHFIEWIALQTKSGNQRKALKPGDAPEAVFALVPGDEVLSASAYCNLHSLWKG